MTDRVARGRNRRGETPALCFYSPPNHPGGTVHKTKAEAEAAAAAHA